MSESVLSILLDAGPLGLFLIYMIHQRQKDSVRMQEQQDKFLKRMDELDQRNDAAVSALRDRYDKVLHSYNTERVQLISGFAKLDQIIMRLGANPAQATIPPPPATVTEPPGAGVTLQIEQKVQEAMAKLQPKGED